MRNRDFVDYLVVSGTWTCYNPGNLEVYCCWDMRLTPGCLVPYTLQISSVHHCHMAAYTEIHTKKLHVARSHTKFKDKSNIFYISFARMQTCVRFEVITKYITKGLPLIGKKNSKVAWQTDRQTLHVLMQFGQNYDMFVYIFNG